jgi:hypothetical protein
VLVCVCACVGWFSVVLQKHVLLCNACGLKYSKSQYCPYCYFGKFLFLPRLVVGDVRVATFLVIRVLGWFCVA